MKTIVLLGVVILSSGCVNYDLPKTAAEVANQTITVAGDGYGRKGGEVAGPTLSLGTGAWGKLIWVGDGFVMQCDLNYRDLLNRMQRASTNTGVDIPLRRTEGDIAKELTSNMESFVLVFVDEEIIRRGKSTGVRIKLYGTRDEREFEIPSWYLEGFLSKTGRKS